MKPILVAIVVAFSYVQQGSTDEHYPGSSSHDHPPSDYWCSRDAADPARKCECHRVHAKGQMCEDEPEVSECKSWCWEKDHLVDDPKGRYINPVTGAKSRMERSHCHCPIECPKDGHPEASENPSPTDHSAHK